MRSCTSPTCSPAASPPTTGSWILPAGSWPPSGLPCWPRRGVFGAGGLRSSLARLPAIESSFGPDVLSGTGSRGLGQLKAVTARGFGPVVNRRRDERLEPDLATRAAARYLAVLHAHYGDWPLALAAYNVGEGRVDRARHRDPGASFWQLTDNRRLPRASRDYVARFLALVRVVDGAADR